MLSEINRKDMKNWNIFIIETSKLFSTNKRAFCGGENEQTKNTPKV